MKEKVYKWSDRPGDEGTLPDKVRELNNLVSSVNEGVLRRKVDARPEEMGPFGKRVLLGCWNVTAASGVKQKLPPNFQVLAGPGEWQKYRWLVLKWEGDGELIGLDTSRLCELKELLASGPAREKWLPVLPKQCRGVKTKLFLAHDTGRLLVTVKNRPDYDARLTLYGEAPK